VIRQLLLILFLWQFGAQIQAQSNLVFNKTEYDFGLIGKSELPFEQDFLFRNTSKAEATILSARSVSKALSFIHTHSEVLPGEYGFVKVKLNTLTLDGLFHDEIYITIKVGDEVKSEVIYIRAQVSDQGIKENGRQFNDSEIAISVEVSPDDIENLEGFLGKDRLTQAEAEIVYLRKQVGMKGELISKLSEDLRSKQEKEEENIQRLATLERSLKNSNGGNNAEILGQIRELSNRLSSIQQSDAKLRAEIVSQESTFSKLKHEADSARAYAEQMSLKLAEQFKNQAAAMDRASRLEADLSLKNRIEARQQKQIDSLEYLIASAGMSESDVSVEVIRLKNELEMKLKEQSLQAQHVKSQHDKIERLKQDREALLAQSEDLARNLDTQARANQSLQGKLQSTESRIGKYEAKIDSLTSIASNGIANPKLDSLKQLLVQLESKDDVLKSEISQKDAELQSLENQNAKAKKDMRALEIATSRQLEEAHNLMYRVNQLSTKESEARLEITALRDELKTSRYREDMARISVTSLTNQIADKEHSIASVSQALIQREQELAEAQAMQQAIENELQASLENLKISDHKIDSLNTLAVESDKRKSTLEKDIDALQRQVLQSQQKEFTYVQRATILEAKLENALMSNELAFAELSADVEEMRKERDAMREALAKAEKENSRLKAANSNANRAMSEITKPQKPTSAYFKVDLFVVNSLLPTLPEVSGYKEVSIYEYGGKYHYAIGHFDSIEEAMLEKSKLEKNGFPKALAVGFKNGQPISLKEALETASVD